MTIRETYAMLAEQMGRMARGQGLSVSGREKALCCEIETSVKMLKQHGVIVGPLSAYKRALEDFAHFIDKGNTPDQVLASLRRKAHRVGDVE